MVHQRACRSILITISLKANLDKNDIYPLAEIHLGNKYSLFLGDTKLFINKPHIIRMRTHIETGILYKNNRYIFNFLYPLGGKDFYNYIRVAVINYI